MQYFSYKIPLFFVVNFFMTVITADYGKTHTHSINVKPPRVLRAAASAVFKSALYLCLSAAMGAGFF